MTASSLDLTARTDLNWLADLLGDAQQATSGVEWVIVGALARDLHLSYAHGIQVHRATTDTDLALKVTEWAEYAFIRASLMSGGTFKPDSRVQHRLVHKSGQTIDIVPFGGIETHAGMIAWPPSGAVQMNVLGYKEALAGSVELRLPNNKRVSLVSAFIRARERCLRLENPSDSLSGCGESSTFI